MSDDTAIFNITTLLKQSTPTRHVEPIIFHQYPHDPSLCPVALIRTYLKRREKMVLTPPTTQFFITQRRPYHAASKDTLARWVKDVLKLSGVDTSVFAAHSCRSASSSHAKAVGVSLEVILKCGQWKTLDAFVKFYDKAIARVDFTRNQPFAESIFSLD